MSDTALNAQIGLLRLENARLAAEIVAHAMGTYDEPRVAAVLAGYKWAQHSASFIGAKLRVHVWDAAHKRDCELEAAFRKAEAAAVKGDAHDK